MGSIEFGDCVFCEHFVIDKYGFCYCSFYDLDFLLLPRETHCHFGVDKSMGVSVAYIGC